MSGSSHRACCKSWSNDRACCRKRNNHRACHKAWSSNMTHSSCLLELQSLYEELEQPQCFSQRLEQQPDCTSGHGASPSSEFLLFFSLQCLEQAQQRTHSQSKCRACCKGRSDSRACCNAQNNHWTCCTNWSCHRIYNRSWRIQCIIIMSRGILFPLMLNVNWIL